MRISDRRPGAGTLGPGIRSTTRSPTLDARSPLTDLRRFALFLVLSVVFSVPAVPSNVALASAKEGAQALRVTIDIKPGDQPTTIEPKREGMIPVAILTSPSFDATRIDPATVRIGASGTEAAVFRSAMEDVDKDGDMDLLLLFRVQQMGLECTDSAVRLKGRTRDGQEIEGTEAVKMEGCA